MKNTHFLARLAAPVVLSIVAMFTAAQPSFATGDIVKYDLAGNWQMTTIGQTGCGFGTTLYTFTLNTSGVASNVSYVSHTGCGDSTGSGQTFTIESLNTNGSGTAGLTCGTGCGWTFNIQVSPDRSTFSVIDVNAGNPGNFLEGIAIHQ